MRHALSDSVALFRFVISKGTGSRRAEPVEANKSEDGEFRSFGCIGAGVVGQSPSRSPT